MPSIIDYATHLLILQKRHLLFHGQFPGRFEVSSSVKYSLKCSSKTVQSVLFLTVSATGP